MSDFISTDFNIEILENSIKINNQIYNSPILIFKNNVSTISKNLSLFTVLENLNLDTGTLILIGSNQIISPELMSSWSEWAFEHGFGFEAMSFKSACRFMSILNDEHRKFATLLFPE
jgi:uncharacterized protein